MVVHHVVVHSVVNVVIIFLGTGKFQDRRQVIVIYNPRIARKETHGGIGRIRKGAPRNVQARDQINGQRTGTRSIIVRGRGRRRGWWWSGQIVGAMWMTRRRGGRRRVRPGRERRGSLSHRRRTTTILILIGITRTATKRNGRVNVAQSTARRGRADADIFPIVTRVAIAVHVAKARRRDTRQRIVER